MSEIIYLAGGCLWGVQHFIRSIPGVIATEAGRANGTSQSLSSSYDGYAECVRVEFDVGQISLERLVDCLFEIIDPYSVDKQGEDVGHKYRTGVYSTDRQQLERVTRHLRKRPDYLKLALEVLPLTNYVRSADEHQDRLLLHPEDCSMCYIPDEIMNKYRN